MSAAHPTQLVEAGRIHGLDGLRALAAAMVFGLHAWGHAGLAAPQLAFGGRSWTLSPGFGSTGVALFFVLSGFLLGQPFWRALHIGTAVHLQAYLGRRLRRVYPAYAVAVVVMALVHDVAHPAWQRLAHLLSHLLLVHNLTEATIFSLSVPLWSVATEFQLYLALPLLFVPLARAPLRRVPTWAMAVALVIASGLGAKLAVAGLEAAALLTPDPRLVRSGGAVLQHSFLAGMPDFCVGVACGLAYRKLRRYRVPVFLAESGAVASLAGIAVYALAFHRLDPRQLSHWPVLSLLFGVLVVSVSLSTAPWGIARLLEMPPLRALGMASYSFYLYHDLVLWNVFQRLQPIASPASDASRLGLIGLAFGLTAVVAWLSYRWAERPFLHAGGRALRRETAVAEPAQ